MTGNSKIVFVIAKNLFKIEDEEMRESIMNNFFLNIRVSLSVSS